MAGYSWRSKLNTYRWRKLHPEATREQSRDSSQTYYDTHRELVLEKAHKRYAYAKEGERLRKIDL